MKNHGTVNRRKYPRYVSPADVYVTSISETNQATGFLIDLNMNGASFEYIYINERWPESNQINILFHQDSFRIDEIPFRFIFDTDANDQNPGPVNWHRVGIQFGELTVKQKNGLRYLINRLWGYTAQLSASSLSETAASLPMDMNDIFLSRLKLLVIAGKAYLKQYPFGSYRKKAISRNAGMILEQIEQQDIFKFGESHIILLKEQILLLANAFSKMPIKSYGKLDIENSIDYISAQLTTETTLIPMAFLNVA